MKIRSNSLTDADVKQAFRDARETDKQDIFAVDLRTFKPRSHRYGVEVYAESVNGTKATGHMPIGPGPRDDYPRAASWHAWGFVMARLFAKDAQAEIGWYVGKSDFVAKTHGDRRYDADQDFLDLMWYLSQ